MAESSTRDAMSGDAATNALAGAVAGGFVLTALFPLDVAKTTMQARGSSVVDMAQSLKNSDKPLRRLYSGLSPAVMEQMLNRSMLFGVGAFIKQQSPQAWSEPVRDAASGAGAALVKTLVLHPIDTIKCRWQVEQHALQLSGLYRGLAPAIVRSSFGMGIWLTSRNTLERSLPDHSDGWRFARSFLSGALSSALTDLLTFPFDTLKKSMQASHPTRMLVQVQRLLTEGGFARFYRGYAARLLMISVNGALFNKTFVYTKALLSG